jgi:hypothetical protein
LGFPLNLEQAYKKYKGSTHTSNSDLWDLCAVAFQTVGNYKKGQTRQTAESIGTSVDSLENWAMVGLMIEVCAGARIPDGDMGVSLRLLWDMDILSFDHLIRAAKLMRRHEISPENILENLLSALESGWSAEKLQREIEEQEMDFKLLRKRDLKGLYKRVEQDSALFEYQGVSAALRRARDLFLGRLRKEIE